MENKYLFMTIAILTIAIHSVAQEMGKLTDSRDGHTYKTVVIGKQVWMAENLNFNTANSWCNKCETYGRLYTYDAALKACPSGWHLPTDSEWATLTNYTGGENLCKFQLKSIPVFQLRKNTT